MAFMGTMVSLITTSVIGVAVNDTSTLLLSIAKNYVYDYSDFKDLIDKLDLYSKLNVIEAFMTDIPDKKYENNKTITIALQNLHEIVLTLQNELNIINKILEEHHNVYFHYWRTPSCSQNLINIEKYNSILNKRFETLLNIIKIQFIF